MGLAGESAMADMSSMAMELMPGMSGSEEMPTSDRTPSAPLPDAPCPFSAATYGGCASTAVVSTQVAVLLAPPASLGQPPANALEPDLLLGSSLFHPPRA